MEDGTKVVLGEAAEPVIWELPAPGLVVVGATGGGKHGVARDEISPDKEGEQS